MGLHVAALRFFFVRVLKRRALKEELPTPKRHRRLPTVLSPDEVRQLIAGAKNLYHRTMLMTLFGTGLRSSELLQLKVADIDSQRMVIRVERGKSGHGREVPLSPTLLTALREYLPVDAAEDVPLSGAGTRLAGRQAAHVQMHLGRSARRRKDGRHRSSRQPHTLRRVSAEQKFASIDDTC